MAARGWCRIWWNSGILSAGQERMNDTETVGILCDFLGWCFTLDPGVIAVRPSWCCVILHYVWKTGPISSQSAPKRSLGFRCEALLVDQLPALVG